MSTMTETPLAAAGKPWRRLSAYIAGGALALLLVLGVAGWVAYTSGTVNPERGARVACQDAITGRLLVPSTANFVGSVRVTRGTGRAYIDNEFRPYVVEGNVDAENKVSQVVHMRYRCEVTRDGGSWRLLGEPILD